MPSIKDTLQEYLTGTGRRGKAAEDPAPAPSPPPPSQAGFFTTLSQEEILERERKKAEAIRKFERR